MSENEPEEFEPEALLFEFDIWTKKEQSLIRNESPIKHLNEKLGLGSNNIIYKLEKGCRNLTCK